MKRYRVTVCDPTGQTLVDARDLTEAEGEKLLWLFTRKACAIMEELGGQSTFRVWALEYDSPVHR